MREKKEKRITESKNLICKWSWDDTETINFKDLKEKNRMLEEKNRALEDKIDKMDTEEPEEDPRIEDERENGDK